SVSLNGSESGGEVCPASFFASSGPAIAASTERGIERQNHEFTASTQNNSTTSYHTHTPLLCAFTAAQSTMPKRWDRKFHRSGKWRADPCLHGDQQYRRGYRRACCQYYRTV